MRCCASSARSSSSRERPARERIGRVRQLERRLDRIDAADQIVVLRRRREGVELLPADGQEHAARRRAERRRPRRRCRRPRSSGRRPAPSRPAAQRNERHAGLSRRRRRHAPTSGGVGVRGVDQHVDPLGGEIIRQTLGAAEAADAHRNRLGGRCAVRPASDSVTLRSATAGERRPAPRLGGAAEDQNVSCPLVRSP